MSFFAYPINSVYKSSRYQPVTVVLHEQYLHQDLTLVIHAFQAVLALQCRLATVTVYAFKFHGSCSQQWCSLHMYIIYIYTHMHHDDLVLQRVSWQLAVPHQTYACVQLNIHYCFSRIQHAHNRNSLAADHLTSCASRQCFTMTLKVDGF